EAIHPGTIPRYLREPAPGSDGHARHIPADQAEDADDDEIQRDDVIQQARNEEDEDAGDQRHDRRDGDAHEHGSLPKLSTGIVLQRPYFLSPLAAPCMSLPACSTDFPAWPMARSASRPAFSMGPPFSSRLHAASSVNAAARSANAIDLIRTPCWSPGSCGNGN